MQEDPIVGTWTLDTAGSEFDPNHRPTEATMTFERESEGTYVLRAEGTTKKGKCVEKPQRIVADSQPHPVPDLPGLTMISSRPNANTLQSEVRREDGSVAGGGTWEVSADGESLRVTNFGYDTQLREFKQITSWKRQ